MTWLDLHRQLDAALEQLGEPLPEWSDLGGHWDHWDTRFGQEDDTASPGFGPLIAAIAEGRPLPPLTPPERLLLCWRLEYASDWIYGILHLPTQPPLPPKPVPWALETLWRASGWPSIHSMIESLLRALPPGIAGAN